MYMHIYICMISCNAAWFQVKILDSIKIHMHLHTSVNSQPQHTKIAGTCRYTYLLIFQPSLPLIFTVRSSPSPPLRWVSQLLPALLLEPHLCSQRRSWTSHGTSCSGRLGRFRNGLGWRSWTKYWKCLSNIIQPEVCTKKNYISTAWNNIFQTSISLISSLLPKLEELV